MLQQSLLRNEMNEPLAARLRPETLDDIIGQEHLIGEGKVLRKMIESDDVEGLNSAMHRANSIQRIIK